MVKMAQLEGDIGPHLVERRNIYIPSTIFRRRNMCTYFVDAPPTKYIFRNIPSYDADKVEKKKISIRKMKIFRRMSPHKEWP